MIVELNIKNFAIIDDLNINFTRGLNVITGETGAGKSILIDAIGVLLGSRSSKDLIQKGKDKVIIEGVFYLEEPDLLRDALKEYYIDPSEDDIIIITKEINMSSPSISKINGKTVNLSMLKSITDKLVDINGQHEHQSLLDTSKHIEIIDSLADKDFDDLKDQTTDLYEKLVKEKNKLKDLSLDRAQRDREIDILKFQIDEIEDAKLSPDDEEDLGLEYKKLSNVNNIRAYIDEAINYLNTSSFNDIDATSLINRSLALIGDGKRYDEKLEPIYSSLAGINYELQDINRELAHYMETISLDDERLDYLRERIDLVNKLKNKYGNTIDIILKFKDQANERLESLINIESEVARIRANIEGLEGQLEALCP